MIALSLREFSQIPPVIPTYRIFLPIYLLLPGITSLSWRAMFIASATPSHTGFASVTVPFCISTLE